MLYRDIDWQKYGISFPYCLAPWKVACVQADGNVRPCCIYPPVMGNTNEKALEQIWNDEPYQKLRCAMFGKEALPEVCLNCHDSMRKIDIDRYIKSAIEHFIENKAESIDAIESLLADMIQKDYMTLPAIHLMAKVYRKKNKYDRELYCLATCSPSSERPVEQDRIKYLRKYFRGKARYKNNVLFDVVFWARLRAGMPDLTPRFIKLLGREYETADKFIQDMGVVAEDMSLTPYRNMILKEFIRYKNPMLIARSQLMLTLIKVAWKVPGFQILLNIKNRLSVSQLIWVISTIARKVPGFKMLLNIKKRFFVR